MTWEGKKVCRWCLTMLTPAAGMIIDRRTEPGGVEVRYYCDAECFQRDNDLPTEKDEKPGLKFDATGTDSDNQTYSFSDGSQISTLTDVADVGGESE